MSDSIQWEIPGHLSLLAGDGGMTKAVVKTATCTAELYLHGAHVTRFQKSGEAPLLFMSKASEFAAGRPIRGGVPLIFPWFGPREGMPAHGFARTTEWELVETTLLPDGAVTLKLRLPTDEAFEVEYRVTVAADLTMELVVRNSADHEVTIENCLHTYFQISAIDTVSITGLAGVTYLDKVAGTTCTESPAPIRVAGEVDRVYLDTPSTVEIVDPGLCRTIRVAKSGSHSTVVWNPWIEKSKRMPDFGDDEYPQMLCVESGNVAANKITLSPGASTALKVVVSSAPTAQLPGV